MNYIITEEQLGGFADGIRALLEGLYKNNPYIYDIISQPISDEDFEEDESIEIVIVFNYDKIIHLSETSKNLLRIKYQKDVRNYVEKFFPNIEFGVYTQVKKPNILHNEGINENKINSFEKLLTSYFEDNFTPDEPWDDIAKSIFKYKDKPTFRRLHLDDSGYNFYEYYNCELIDHSLGEGHDVLCPAVDIDPDMYENLNSMFGGKWKPLFIRWFNSKLKGVEIKNVDFIS